VADGGAQDRQALAGMGVLARKLARARGDAPPSAAFDADLPPLGSAMGFAGDDTPAAQDSDLRAWRMALARAARDQLKMTVGFSSLTARQTSLTEVLEVPMQRALIVMLQGQGEGMGLLVLSGQMLAAMIEMLTLTRLSPHSPSDDDLRKPTRTDAAMAVEFIDAALAGFESLQEGGQGGSWAAGYRYAAFIDDPRPLHLMLEDCEYHLFCADLALEDGSRSGAIALALPRAPVPMPVFDFTPEPSFDTADDAPNFTQDLGDIVQKLPVQINASIAQITLPIERVLRLQVGEVLALPLAALDQISVLGLDGRRIAGGRLGQNRGMRALRLTDVDAARSHLPHPAAPAGHSYGAPALDVLPADFGLPTGLGLGTDVAVVQSEDNLGLGDFAALQGAG